MKVAVGELILCWGDWKHCVEWVSAGHMKEGAGVSERKNRNQQECRVDLVLFSATHGTTHDSALLAFSRTGLC